MGESQFDVILDHYRNPRNYGELSDASVKVKDSNPLCGDVVEVYLKINGGVVEKASFRGHGCAISQASASMLIESIQGKSLDDVKALDKGSVFEMLGIEVGPVRVKCALLPLKALKAAVYSYLGTKMDTREFEE
ncbi:MAG: SUF system NifU family Fe-S cluster assembly protein [Candidatus Caldarchaeum sp.]|nr:SUF system NifU family Fe-S cluster assembly protein [Candidatus Caldarchaeum sp.]MCX8200511.1 SUF system NifU family Fe-S cluster assembly protein [Candidatus Caldarchaeum sp.]MDW8435133.1 SUF system NifU family Fe-S cluster assembly protein [Candidatus Caldarchaeum sp.]